MKSTQERINDINGKLADARRKKARRNKILISVASCAAAFVLVFGLVLFLPFPSQNIAKYRDSEYYSLICKLDEMDRSQPKYKNNFYKLSASVSDFFGNFAFGSAKGDAMEAPGAPGTPGTPGTSESPIPDESGTYEEVTNNQVKGVTEGDLFKRSDKNIYYLSCHGENYRLDVYPIAGMETKKSAELEIAPDKDMYISFYSNRRELYLSEDTTTAYVISPSYNKNSGILYSVVIQIDLTGETPKEKGRVYVSGDYISSRFVNGKILLVSNFFVKKFNYDDEKLFLPQSGPLGNLKSIPMDDIVIPDNANSSRYTVICSVDTDTFQVTDGTAFLSYSQEVYVSENHIYATFSHRGQTESNNAKRPVNKTLVSCVAYAPSFELKGNIDVEGMLNDRYSMDEHEGVFRIFTTTETDTTGLTSASLFCYSLNDFSMIASVKNFAPERETVQSARFQGDTAYVCTAIVIQLTDPVFAFDLSDYENIGYTDTGTITGYSLFLIPFTNDLLLGIGVDDKNDLKLELYAETDDSVISLARYETNISDFAKEFKSYHIDKEKGTVGLAVYDYITHKYSYLLWQYDGYRFNQPKEIIFNGYYETMDEVRGTIVGDVFYLFAPQSGLYLSEI